ncbi:MAG: hypothetical protein ACLPVW_02770 [Terriglobales bacterium]
MKPAHPYGVIAVWAAVGFAVVWSMTASLCAQEATTPRHAGVPQDWSQQHIVFSRAGLAQHPDLIYREPRVLHQAMQRWQAPNFGAFEGSEPVAASADNPGPDRDWNFTLGARVLLNVYPAKFSFNPGAQPSCNDYVVYGLNLTSTGATANLVALNNLYAGTPAGLCGTAPTVLFAYDVTTVTGGKVETSPVLSEDGKKIAFIEDIPADAGLGITAESIFHVLTWTAGQGTIGGAVAPTNWVSVPLTTAKNDITSSPWIDYYTDTAYVGSASGYVYEITGVFRGTPTLVTTPPWPILVVANNALTSPVLDSNRNMLMFGAANGDLYGINTTTGAVKHLAVGQGGATHAFLAAPIVDVTNGVTFAVNPYCGTACYDSNPAGAVLVEVNTATLALLTEVSLGEGSPTGTTIDLYQPALDNNYYNNPTTGLIHLCGTGPADATPYHYAFGFTETGGFPVLNALPAVDQQLPTVPAGTTANCTGWTEFFNPNIGTGGTDFFFFGLNQACTAAGTAGGCVEELAINGGTPTFTTVKINGGPTGVIVDNYSTAAQASSIYFAARLATTAYKYTQNGLN